MMTPWNEELRTAYSSVDELAGAGLLAAGEADRLSALGARFKVRITPYYARLMKPSPDCPIRQQAIPALGEEDPELPLWARALSREVFGREEPWHLDAIGDVARLAAPRLTHRYENRAILHLSSACAVYCRFCFRKTHLNDADRTLYDGSLDPAFEYLARTPAIRELILTGGDPLSLPDAQLGRVFDRLVEIPHIKVVRIHSRMAVTLPARLTPELAALCGAARGFHLTLVSHFNHRRELTPEALAGLERMRRAGVTLLNQSVLLAGVNDSPEALGRLFQGLYENGVIPFYLHHPDWTPGTFQFRPSIERGRALMAELRGRLPGPALPEYVLDLPQGFGKVPLSEARRLSEHGDSAMGGAIYELPVPATRDRDLEQGPARRLYLDLFYRRPRLVC